MKGCTLDALDNFTIKKGCINVKDARRKRA